MPHNKLSGWKGGFWRRDPDPFTIAIRKVPVVFEPGTWGPWTTAFHTENWGVGRTHGYRLPAKWIDRGGRTMTLIFSGLAPYDAFCVCRMIIEAH